MRQMSLSVVGVVVGAGVAAARVWVLLAGLGLGTCWCYGNAVIKSGLGLLTAMHRTSALIMLNQVSELEDARSDVWRPVCSSYGN